MRDMKLKEQLRKDKKNEAKEGRSGFERKAIVWKIFKKNKKKNIIKSEKGKTMKYKKK